MQISIMIVALQSIMCESAMNGYHPMWPHPQLNRHLINQVRCEEASQLRLRLRPDKREAAEQSR